MYEADDGQVIPCFFESYLHIYINSIPVKEVIGICFIYQIMIKISCTKIFCTKMCYKMRVVRSIVSKSFTRPHFIDWKFNTDKHFKDVILRFFQLLQKRTWKTTWKLWKTKKNLNMHFFKNSDFCYFVGTFRDFKR